MADGLDTAAPASPMGAGVPLPDNRAPAWLAAGFDLEDAAEWRDAMFSADDAGLWVELKVTIEAARRCRDIRMRPQRLRKWMADLAALTTDAPDMDPDTAIGWLEHRFEPAEALALSAAGVTPRTAAAVRTAGAAPEQMELLAKHGWSDEAIRRARDDRSMMTSAVLEWASAGFSPDEASDWHAQRIDPSDAATLRDMGVDADGAGAFRAAGLRSDEIATWVRREFAPSAAAAWNRRSIAPDLAAAWDTAGFDPDLAAQWQRAGFAIPDASEWRAKGFRA